MLPMDLVDKARIMSKAYEYLYCIENVLRNFLDTHPEKNKFIIPTGVQKAISDRKNDESKNRWLALRGSNDLYYMDFKDLGGIINNNWDLFKSYFPSQYWIIAKIEDLTRCRNLIAHNSYIDVHELNLIKANFNSIIRQLQLSPDISPSDTSNTESEMFVKGLKYSKLYNKQQADEGIEYQINYPPDLEVAPALLRVFYNQVGLSFQVCYDNARVDVTPEFKIGYQDDYNFKDNIRFQFGLYDIDEDGIDELFICLSDNDDSAENGVQVSVIKYFPPAFKMHAYRPENWSLIGNFEVQMVLGEPIAYIEKNSITVHRNLRGFYYEWTYVRGNFVYTGNF